MAGKKKKEGTPTNWSETGAMWPPGFRKLIKSQLIQTCVQACSSGASPNNSPCSIPTAIPNCFRSFFDLSLPSLVKNVVTLNQSHTVPSLQHKSCSFWTCFLMDPSQLPKYYLSRDLRVNLHHISSKLGETGPRIPCLPMSVDELQNHNFVHEVTLDSYTVSQSQTTWFSARLRANTRDKFRAVS